MYYMKINNNNAGACQHEEAEVEEVSVEEYHDVRGATSSARLTFVGKPAKVTHMLFGDSNVRRVADLMTPAEVSASGSLVLVHMPGSMSRFASLVKPISRLVYRLYPDSFDDPKNKVQLAVCLGYNDPEASLKEYYRDCVRVLIELKHAFGGVAAKVEIQLGEFLYNKSSLHPTSALRNFIHNQLSMMTGNITPLRLWAAQLGPDLPEKKIKPVNATNIDLRIKRDTLEEDKWHHNQGVMMATKHVVLDWYAGVVTEEAGTPLRTPYRFLRDFEAYLPGATLEVGQDVFGDRDKLFLEHTQNPLCEVTANRLDELPLPAMRLESLLGRVKRRPEMVDDRSSVSSSSSVFDRLSGSGGQQQQQQQGRGRGGGAREARVRFTPYGGRGGSGGRGRRW